VELAVLSTLDGERRRLEDSIKYFQTKEEIAVADELRRKIQEGATTPEIVALLGEMERLEWAISVPLYVKERLIGILGLSEKKSGDMFTIDDLRTLDIIASQTAITLENAQLYEETKNFSQTLQREVERQTAELKKVNEDLLKLDKAKSDFISIASHQLRTPLSIIKGFISMLLEGSYGKMNKEVRDKLEKTYSSAERLVKLVDALLDLTHMEGGKMQFNYGKVNFSEMVQSVIGELAPQAEHKKLKLKLVRSDEPFFVWADGEKLRQVIMNLIDNAIKYTEKGCVSVFLEKSGNACQFAVKDTGMGMQPDEITKLFQKFVRGANAPRLHTEGAGVGLYVAKKLIEEQKGQVWAESEGEGKGSTFFVRMPESK